MNRAEFEKKLDEFTAVGKEPYISIHGVVCSGIDGKQCCLDMEHVRDFLRGIIEDVEATGYSDGRHDGFQEVGSENKKEEYECLYR